MIKTIKNFTPVEVFYIAIWSLVCTVSIIVIFITYHQNSENTMSVRLSAIEKQINQKTADRYHATDAKRDFALVTEELKSIRNDCGCKKEK